MKPGISVIICCYNGAARLPETLRHLALQQVSPQISWEIIIVDNASTDGTGAVAHTEWQQHNLPGVNFNVLSEKRPRKYYALQTGVAKAAHEFIMICDDDNRLNHNYINQAFQIISSNNKIAAVGGQGIAVSDGQIPGWFWPDQHIYAVGKPAAGSGDVSAKGYLWGAGMVFRKALYQRVNLDLPSLLLGPDQQETARAEDVELCMRFIMAGYRLYYDEALVFEHFIDSTRLTDSYRNKLLDAGSHEIRVLNLYRKQIAINNLHVLKKAWLLCATLLRYFTCKVFPGLRTWNYQYEAEVLYMLTGLKITGISDEAADIGALNRRLSKKSIA